MNQQKHTSFRYGREEDKYLDHLSELWGIDNRSEVLRILIKAFNGLLFGRFLALLDGGKLRENWGAIGETLALMKQDPPDGMEEANLASVLKSVPTLVGAAKVELEGVPIEEEKD